METVEVKILKYAFRFRKLNWREETSLKFKEGEDRLRTILSHALTEISGLKVESQEAAMKVLMAIPGTVIQRVFILYKGSYPMPRRFATMGLYQAPAPGKIQKRMEEVSAQREETMDRVERELESKFGSREIHETLEVERQMLKNSGMRGATRATPDEKLFGVTPPIGGKKHAN